MRSPSDSSSSSGNELGSPVDDIHPLHPGHPLAFLYGDSSWRCDGRDAQGGCRALGKPRRFQRDVGSYSCDVCEFDLCHACFDGRSVCFDEPHPLETLRAKSFEPAGAHGTGPGVEPVAEAAPKPLSGRVKAISFKEQAEDFVAAGGVPGGAAESKIPERFIRNAVSTAAAKLTPTEPPSESDCSSSEDEPGPFDAPSLPRATFSPAAPSMKPAKSQAPKVSPVEPFEARGEHDCVATDKGEREANFTNGAFSVSRYSKDSRERFHRPYDFGGDHETALAHPLPLGLQAPIAAEDAIAEAAYLSANKLRRRLLDAEVKAGTFKPWLPGQRGSLFLPRGQVRGGRDACIQPYDPTARQYTVSVAATRLLVRPKRPAAVHVIKDHCFNWAR